MLDLVNILPVECVDDGSENLLLYSGGSDGCRYKDKGDQNRGAIDEG